MTAAVALPLWALLLLVASAPFTGWLGVRYGAKQAIVLCSSHWGCDMQASKRRDSDTHDLKKQLQALREAHPELANLRKATADAFKDTGDHPTIPDRSRAKPDEDGQR
jgi:hypothetical protein